MKLVIHKQSFYNIVRPVGLKNFFDLKWPVRVIRGHLDKKNNKIIIQPLPDPTSLCHAEQASAATTFYSSGKYPSSIVKG